MPKLLIAFSDAKKDRKAATSSQNLKALIEKRIAKDASDTSYTVITINDKMKLANVVTLINSSKNKLSDSEAMQTIETYTIDPSKERGKWKIAPLSAADDKPKTKKVKAPNGESEAPPKKKKKKKVKKTDD